MSGAAADGPADCVVGAESSDAPADAVILGESHPAVDSEDPGEVRYRHRTCDPSDYDPPEPTMWM
jgi:hypothetical protein